LTNCSIGDVGLEPVQLFRVAVELVVATDTSLLPTIAAMVVVTTLGKDTDDDGKGDVDGGVLVSSNGLLAAEEEEHELPKDSGDGDIVGETCVSCGGEGIDDSTDEVSVGISFSATSLSDGISLV
jgi:hypothetical protein